ncbi:hypothetical protein C5167_008683 [Papaver somniferum]|uniref:Tyrosine-specific transport protein n=1 Tax=Papaver somniferum TaxID=3469 RepID=A0A4Y7JV76_PAPSO|nr:uncharacterized protein LOC113287236 [Papaver somniferum]RZC64994.1 hypothetical protein C5167_008683 [Papaver somniferum]
MILSPKFNLNKFTHLSLGEDGLKPKLPICHSINTNSTLFTQIPKHSTLIPKRFSTLINTREKFSITNINGAEEDPPEKCLTANVNEKAHEKSFWGAVSLIIGTAVGPGMLGLPSATMKSGPFPSTISILLSWVYVISSILLVAELSFASMEEDKVAEVSFTGLATTALGSWMGMLVAVIYASLSFSLIVACVSGIGSIMIQWFPWMNLVVAHALFPLLVGIVIGYFPFKAIDSTNRFLCFLMLFSITALIATGLSVGRTKLLSSFGYSSWGLSAILPAIPVTVLTLGFHVITPFICKIVGESVFDARRAILFGGTVPLIMVLSWNLVVLGLAKTNRAVSSQDPISLLLSVNSSVLPAVQGFAFSALSTSLIGYAVSFPKQLVDTLELIWRETSSENVKLSSLVGSNRNSRMGKVGSGVYSSGKNVGSVGQISFSGSRFISDSGSRIVSSYLGTAAVNMIVMPFVLAVPIVIASFFPSAFSKALDFAGVYANCFLFGILPPLMAWIHRSRRKSRSSRDVNLLPGGDAVLLLLFVIAVILGIWH